MARLNVNTNRMELSNIRKRLEIALSGHKLLKDKQDELMRQFIVFIKLNRELRKKVELELQNAFKDFFLASSTMSPEMLEEAVCFPQKKLSVNMEKKNIMNVLVPVFRLQQKADGSENNLYPYGYVHSSSELDDAIYNLYKLLPDLLELAEIEKTCQLLSDEIEQTRRRVNALEHRIIPELKETIRYIAIKLDENERSTITRLIKVKEMIDK